LLELTDSENLLMKSSLPEADRHDASDTQKKGYKPCEIPPDNYRDGL